VTEHPEQPAAPDSGIPTVVPERHLVPEFPDAPPESPHGVGFIEVEKPLRRKPAPKLTGEKRAKQPNAALPSAPTSTPTSGPTAKTVSTPAPKPTSKPKPTAKTAKPTKTPRYTLVTVVSALRALSVTFAAAVIVATIFMWWTSPDFLPVQARRDLAPVQATARQVAARPTLLPTPIWFNRIGILAGHSGLYAADGSQRDNPDPGAICPDGFFERSVTEAVAERAAALLRARGFTVDVLGEFDPRLDGYEAAAFLSLHADSCVDVGYGGFKSAYPVARTNVRALDVRFDDCMRANYGGITALQFLPGNITDNMRLYHAFRKIGPRTPAVILELGFLSFDRNLLQNQPDRMALGVVNGIMCFLQPDVAPTATTQP